MFIEELKDLRLQIVDAQDAQHRMEVEKGKIAEQLYHAKADLQESEEKLSAAEREQQSLRGDLSSAREKVQHLAVAESKLADANSEIRDLKQAIVHLSDELKEEKAINQLLATQIGETEARAERLEQELIPTREIVKAHKQRVAIEERISAEVART